MVTEIVQTLDTCGRLQTDASFDFGKCRTRMVDCLVDMTQLPACVA